MTIFLAKSVANFRRSLEGDFRAAFAGKIVRSISHQNSTANFTIKLHAFLGFGGPYNFRGFKRPRGAERPWLKTHTQGHVPFCAVHSLLASVEAMTYGLIQGSSEPFPFVTLAGMPLVYCWTPSRTSQQDTCRCSCCSCSNAKFRVPRAQHINQKYASDPHPPHARQKHEETSGQNMTPNASKQGRFSSLGAILLFLACGGWGFKKS